MVSLTQSVVRLLAKHANGAQLFSTSCSWANRAFIYSQTGNPSTVLTALTYAPLHHPAPNTLNIKFLLSPINPADINVIEGVYPLKPSPTTALAASGKGSKDHPVFIAGNEGLAEVTDVGRGVTHLEKKDWVVMPKQQLGTWSTSKNVSVGDVLKVPRVDALSEVLAATMTVCLYIIF
jgi:trans-2-enoyl-CoA reductase